MYTNVSKVICLYKFEHIHISTHNSLKEVNLRYIHGYFLEVTFGISLLKLSDKTIFFCNYKLMRSFTLTFFHWRKNTIKFNMQMSDNIFGLKIHHESYSLYIINMTIDMGNIIY